MPRKIFRPPLAEDVKAQTLGRMAWHAESILSGSDTSVYLARVGEGSDKASGWPVVALVWSTALTLFCALAYRVLSVESVYAV